MKSIDIMEALGDVPAETVEAALAVSPKRINGIIRRKILRIAASVVIVLLAAAAFKFFRLRAAAKSDPVLEILGVDQSGFSFKGLFPLKTAQDSDVCVNFRHAPYQTVYCFQNGADDTLIYDAKYRLTSYRRSNAVQTFVENPLSEEDVTAIATGIAAQIDPEFVLVKSRFNAGGFPASLYYLEFHKPVGRDAFDALTISIFEDGTVYSLTHGVCDVPESYTDDRARAKLLKYIEETEDPKYSAQYSDYHGYEIGGECSYTKIGWHVYAFYSVEYLLDKKGVVRDAVMYIVRD